MALTVPGGYCSHVTLHSRHYRNTSTSCRNNRISISPPWREKMARPHARRGFIGGQKKKEGWLISVTFISVVLVAGLLAGTWILECPASPLTASPSHFLTPCRIMFQASSGRLRSSCRDISQQGPQGPPMRELVTGDAMAYSVPGRPRKRPSGFIAGRQSWQLSPRLKHGRVESIDQLAWYHTQFNTRYAVNPEWLGFLRSGVASSAPVRPDSIDMRLILSGSPSGSGSEFSSRLTVGNRRSTGNLGLRLNIKK